MCQKRLKKLGSSHEEWRQHVLKKLWDVQSILTIPDRNLQFPQLRMSISQLTAHSFYKVVDPLY